MPDVVPACRTSCQGSTCAIFYGKLTCANLGVLGCTCSECCSDTLGAQLPPELTPMPAPMPTPTPACDCSTTNKWSCQKESDDGSTCWALCCTVTIISPESETSKEGRGTPLAVGEGKGASLPTSLPGVAHDGEATGVATGERVPDSQPPLVPKVPPDQSSLPSDYLPGSAAATAVHLKSDQSRDGAPESDQANATAAPLVTALGITAVICILGVTFAARRRLSRRGAGPRHRALSVHETATTPLRLPDLGVRGLPVEISMGLLVPDSVDPVQGSSDTEPFEMVPVPTSASAASAASTHLAPALAVRKATPRVTRGHTRLHDETSEEAEVAASSTRRIRLPAARARIGSTYGRLHNDVEPALQDATVGSASPGPPPGARIYPGPNELDWSCPTSSLPSRVPRLPAEVTDVGFGLD